jgi:hypothetical protein
LLQVGVAVEMRMEIPMEAVEVLVDTVHLLALAAAGLLPNRLFLLP